MTTTDENKILSIKNKPKGVYVHKFKEPFEYEGKKYDTLNFYFNQLTGKDIVVVEKEMAENGEYALDPLISRSLQSKLAARAGGIGNDVIEAMSMSDFMDITRSARDFLSNLGF